jgi:predicted aldo/keto reductase-like oxidoreductase
MWANWKGSGGFKFPSPAYKKTHDSYHHLQNTTYSPNRSPSRNCSHCSHCSHCSRVHIRKFFQLSKGPKHRVTARPYMEGRWYRKPFQFMWANWKGSGGFDFPSSAYKKTHDSYHHLQNTTYSPNRSPSRNCSHCSHCSHCSRVHIRKFFQLSKGPKHRVTARPYMEGRWYRKPFQFMWANWKGSGGFDFPSSAYKKTHDSYHHLQNTTYSPNRSPSRNCSHCSHCSHCSRVHIRKFFQLSKDPKHRVTARPYMEGR